MSTNDIAHVLTRANHVILNLVEVFSSLSNYISESIFIKFIFLLKKIIYENKKYKIEKKKKLHNYVINL